MLTHIICLHKHRTGPLRELRQPIVRELLRKLILKKENIDGTLCQIIAQQHFYFLNAVVLLVRVEKRKIIPSQGLMRDSEDAK